MRKLIDQKRLSRAKLRQAGLLQALLEYLVPPRNLRFAKSLLSQDVTDNSASQTLSDTSNSTSEMEELKARFKFVLHFIPALTFCTGLHGSLVIVRAFA